MRIRVVIGLCCWGGLLWAQAAEPPPAPVRVDAVVALDTAPVTWTPGTVLSRTDAELGAEVAGPVIWIAEPGTHVEAGDEVARVNDELWDLSVQESEARVRGLQQRLKYLRSEATRLESLASVDSAAQSQLEESHANRDEAIENLARARAAVQMNRYRLDKTRIRAPFTGQIVERFVELGEYIEAGTAVVRLVDLANIEIRSQAPLRVAPFVREGMQVSVRSDLGTQQTAVSAVIPVGDLESRTFEVRLKLVAGDWVVGSPVQVGLPTATARRVLTVHRDALVLRESGTSVFALEGAVVRKVDVRTGIGADDRIEIHGAGLEPGTQVVVSGAEMLRDGQAVSFAD